jgi:hypothetical protein
MKYKSPFDDKDFILLWVLGLIMIIAGSVLLANAYVNAAYDVSKVIVK